MRTRTTVLLVMLWTGWSAVPALGQETRADRAEALGIDIEQARLPEPDQVWDIDRAVEIALRNNRSLQVSRLDLATAEKQVKEAYGGLLPEIDGSLGYQRNMTLTAIRRAVAHPGEFTILAGVNR